MIELPLQLQNRDFKFILLKERGKEPLDSNKWLDNLLEFDNPKLLEHLKNGGNYGIVGGYGRLRIMDVDKPEYAERIFDAMDTFAVRTGRGGIHFYFLSDYNTNHKFKDNTGELRADNMYVVGPGSTHPSGNSYIVFDDRSIREIREEELKGIIKKLVMPNPINKTIPVEGSTRPHTLPDFIDALIRSGVPEGQRHVNTWIITKELFNRGFSRPEILENVMFFNKRCLPPKDERIVINHVDYLLTNAERYLTDDWAQKNDYGSLETSIEEETTFGEIMKKDMPPIDYWLEGLVPKSTIILIGGRPGTFKSMFVLSLSLATVMKKTFLQFFYPVDSPKTLLYDLENGQRVIHRRTKYLIGEDMNGLDGFGYAENFDKKNIKSELKRSMKYDIIILDSYRRFLRGEENASEVTDAFYNEFLKPLRDAGKTIIIVHHFRKMRQDEELTDEYMMELFRGSSDLVAQVDAAYALFKTDEEYDRETKQRKLKIAVNIAKNRLGLPLQKFGIDVLQDDKEERTSLNWCTIKKQISAEEEKMNAIEDVLKDGSQERKNILQQIKAILPSLSIPTIDRALRDMEDLGKIKKTSFGVYELC